MSKTILTKIQLLLALSLAITTHNAQALDIVGAIATNHDITTTNTDAINAIQARLNALSDTVDAAIQVGVARSIESSRPTAQNDINSGYTVGTMWVDTTAGAVYIMTDSTPGAAVWRSMSNNTPPVYEVGDIGPAGGYVFWVTGDGSHGLEVAPLDTKDSNGQFISAEWGCMGISINEAQNQDFGAGFENTSIISERGCIDSLGSDKIAARVAEEYDGGTFRPDPTVGKTGWYLPTFVELATLINVNLQLNDKFNLVTNTTSDTHVNRIWSSSQGNNVKAIALNPTDATSLPFWEKTNKFRVRAIKDF